MLRRVYRQRFAHPFQLHQKYQCAGQSPEWWSENIMTRTSTADKKLLRSIRNTRNGLSWTSARGMFVASLMRSEVHRYMLHMLRCYTPKFFVLATSCLANPESICVVVGSQGPLFRASIFVELALQIVGRLYGSFWCHPSAYLHTVPIIMSAFLVCFSELRLDQ